MKIIAKHFALKNDFCNKLWSENKDEIIQPSIFRFSDRYSDRREKYVCLFLKKNCIFILWRKKLLLKNEEKHKNNIV